MLSGPYINHGDTVTTQGSGVVLVKQSLDESKTIDQPSRHTLLKHVNNFFDNGYVELTNNGKKYRIDSDMYEEIRSLVTKAKARKDLTILDGATGLGLSKDEFANIYIRLERIFSISILEEYFLSSPKTEAYFAAIGNLGQDYKTIRYDATIKLLHLGCPAFITHKAINALMRARPVYRAQKDLVGALSETAGN